MDSEFQDFRIKIWYRTILYHNIMPRRKKQGKHLNTNYPLDNREYKRKYRTQHAEKKRRQKEKKYWIDRMEVLDDFSNDLSGEKGKSRAYEENCCYILALRACLRSHISVGETTINWTMIEQEIARALMVKTEYIHQLIVGVMEDGGV